jgi:mediator of RNA polymerase II transcription subunit 7
MEDESELRNPFPSPPSHYVRYTDENLRLLSLLRGSSQDPASSQQEVLSGETSVPSWPLEELEKPRLDLILEDGEYTVFGDCWKVCYSRQIWRLDNNCVSDKGANSWSSRTRRYPTVS